MRKISEIFYSLQGEGSHTETPTVFVCSSGRSLGCNFCDTRHEEGAMMTNGEIVEKTPSFPARMVILTGGKPSLWIDKTLISHSRKVGERVCIETNGTCLLPDSIDWVTRSPKENVPMILEGVGEIRMIYTGQGLPAYTEIPVRYHFL